MRLRRRPPCLRYLLSYLHPLHPLCPLCLLCLMRSMPDY
jgi:hypothetical protein